MRGPPQEVDFSYALMAAKHGERIARAGWNGKGMFLFVLNMLGPVRIPERATAFHPGVRMPTDAVTMYRLEPFICVKTADNKMVPWLASQTDILANDWTVLE